MVNLTPNSPTTPLEPTPGQKATKPLPENIHRVASLASKHISETGKTPPPLDPSRVKAKIQWSFGNVLKMTFASIFGLGFGGVAMHRKLAREARDIQYTADFDNMLVNHEPANTHSQRAADFLTKYYPKTSERPLEGSRIDRATGQERTSEEMSKSIQKEHSKIVNGSSAPYQLTINGVNTSYKDEDAIGQKFAECLKATRHSPGPGSPITILKHFLSGGIFSTPLSLNHQLSSQDLILTAQPTNASISLPSRTPDADPHTFICEADFDVVLQDVRASSPEKANLTRVHVHKECTIVVSDNPEAECTINVKYTYTPVSEPGKK
ncbi:MAG: hypothetical protein P4L16_07975 [Chlamydiales bacterium]|nr:hypothetical protein [Chlamydiales bacterium]